MNTGEASNKVKFKRISHKRKLKNQKSELAYFYKGKIGMKVLQLGDFLISFICLVQS